MNLKMFKSVMLIDQSYCSTHRFELCTDRSISLKLILFAPENRFCCFSALHRHVLVRPLHRQLQPAVRAHRHRREAPEMGEALDHFNVCCLFVAIQMLSPCTKRNSSVVACQGNLDANIESPFIKSSLEFGIACP